MSRAPPASPPHDQPGRLLRVLGVGFGLAVSIGNTIAAGIARTPGEVAASISSPWLFCGVWLAGGLYALLGANCLAELGTALPRSGAQYVFARRALGDYPAFIVGWSDWLSTCGTTAAVSLLIAEYTEVLVPAPILGPAPLACFLTLLFALLQWRGVRWGGAVQNLTSLAKALALVALVAACFLLGGDHGAARASQAPATHRSAFLALVLALQSVIYTYDGWAAPVYFSEELRGADRGIPRALFGGVLCVLAIYLLVNLALVRVLPISQIAGDKFALGTAAAAVFGAHGDAIARGVMVLSMLASLNAYHLMASRVVLAMGRDGLFWRGAASVNAGGTPAVSLWISTGVALLFIAVSGTFQKLIEALAFFFVANYTLSFLSLFVLRRREPELHRPFRAWGHPWTTGLALGGSAAFLLGAIASDLIGDTRSSLHALLILAGSYPAFLCLKRTAGDRAQNL